MPTAPLPPPEHRPWLEPVDVVHASFYAFVLGAAAIALPTLGEPWRPFAWYGAALVSTLLLARALVGRTGLRATVPRVVFTILVAPFSFLMLASVIPTHAFHGERLLHDLDTALFLGTNPNEWLDRRAWPPLTEVLQLVYASYYAIPLVMFAAFLLERRPGALSRGLLTMLLCLYLSYVGYFLIPATGPNRNVLGLYPAHFTEPMPGVLVAEWLRASTLSAEWIKHDCWPSGHTALSLSCLVLTKREGSRAYAILLVPVILLVLSTVYLRYHYVVDVLFGLALTAISIPLGRRLHAGFFRPGSPERGR